MSVAAALMGLVVASVLVIGMMRPYREQRIVIGAIVLVVLALCVVSYTNVYILALPGGESDAKLFNKYAVELLRQGQWPDVSIGTQVYLWILTGFYRLLDPRPAVSEYLLIGQSLSIVVATATLVFINRIAENLGIASGYWRAGVVVVAGLLPVFLLHNALTLREPYQLLGLVMGVYCVLRALDQPTMQLWLCAAAGLFFMGVFHHVLLGVSFVLIGVGVLMPYLSRPATRQGYTIAAVLVVVLGAMAYVTVNVVPATKGNDYVKDIRGKGGLIEAIKGYRGEVEGAQPRTSYSVPIDSSSVVGTAKGLAANYWLYLTEPLWRAPERTADLVPRASSGFRLAMLGLVMWFLIFKSKAHPKILFLGLSYVVITMVWSLGTTNYGQAFRHHSLSDWLLVLMVAYILQCGFGYGRPRSPEDIR